MQNPNPTPNKLLTSSCPDSVFGPGCKAISEFFLLPFKRSQPWLLLFSRPGTKPPKGPKIKTEQAPKETYFTLIGGSNIAHSMYCFSAHLNLQLKIKILYLPCLIYDCELYRIRKHYGANVIHATLIYVGKMGKKKENEINYWILKWAQDFFCCQTTNS